MPKIQLFGCPRNPIHTLGLGVFDGLHLGHKTLASQCQALLTLNPHPAVVLGKDPDLKMLTTLREMHYFFPQIIHLPFTKKLSAVKPEFFLNEVILKQVKPARIVVGYDYRFGSGRTGDFDFLTSWGHTHNIQTEQIPAFRHEGHLVKSSDIRDALTRGDFAHGLSLLGHPYLIVGSVVHGEGRGKKIGFPTANLKLPTQKLIPQLGVYGGYILFGKKQIKAIIYIGKKPTFAGEHDVTVEVHIPDFNESLYGRQLAVFLTHKIRGEATFPNVDALIKQIKLDLKRI